MMGLVRENRPTVSESHFRVCRTASTVEGSMRYMGPLRFIFTLPT